MEKKKKLIILGIIALTLVIIGTTYAILTWTSTKINLGLNSGCFTIDYTKGQDISGNLKLLNESDLISSNKFTIKNGIGISAVNIGIKSTCTIEGFGSIYLNITNISEAFTTGDSKGALKYAVLSNTSTVTTPSSVTVESLLNQSFQIVAKGSIESSGKKLLYKMELSNTEINKYIIVIYVDNFLAGNSITSATFSGNISSEAEQKSPDYDANFEIETNEEDGTATIRGAFVQEKDVVIPKMLRKVTYTADVVSNPSEEVISACEDFFVNDAEMPSDLLGDVCKNGKSGFRDMTLKEIITENILPFSKLKQLEKIGSITLQISYSSKKYTVTSIGENGFYKRQLTSVVIPSSVTTIGHSAFRGNQLTSVVIPSSVTTIDNNAFCDNQLTSVVIPSSVDEIKDQVFWVNKLTSVVIPSSVTMIGESAFRDNRLASITIPNSVTTIKPVAFGGNQLTSVVIPSSVSNIAGDIFQFNELVNIVVDSNNSVYDSRDNCNAIIETSSNKLIQGSKNTIIPNSVTSIGNYAFMGQQLINIVIPNSVTAIGDSAFCCNKLTNVTIPSSITFIGPSAFSFNNLEYIIDEKSGFGSTYSQTFSSSNREITDNGVTYADNPNLKKIYNNSGKSYNWNFAVNGKSSSSFATGTTNVRIDGDTTYNAVTVTTGQPS